jgi:hypothetical protein
MTSQRTSVFRCFHGNFHVRDNLPLGSSALDSISLPCHSVERHSRSPWLPSPYLEGDNYEVFVIAIGVLVERAAVRAIAEKSAIGGKV